MTTLRQATKPPGQAPPVFPPGQLSINEIYYTIQGECGWMGTPTVFVRTSHCPLRCVWCDSKYTFYEGKPKTTNDVIAEVEKHPTKHVCLTGGEPLAQLESFNLASSWVLVGIASMRKRYAGQDKKVMSAILATPHASYGMKLLIIVDHDVDPFNLDQVMWALATRFNPATGVTFINEATMNPLDPIAPGKAYGTKMVLNATEPKPPQPVPAIGIVKPPPETDRWRGILEKRWK